MRQTKRRVSTQTKKKARTARVSQPGRAQSTRVSSSGAKPQSRSIRKRSSAA